MALFILFIVVTAVIFEVISLRRVLKNVTCTIETSKKVVDPGEVFEVVTTIENNKLLPVTSLRVCENVPEEITYAEDELEYDIAIKHNKMSNATVAEWKTYLMPKQKLTKRVPVMIERRGRYFFSGATVYGGDFLGFSETAEGYYGMNEVVVLPRKIECSAEIEALGGFLGDVSVRRFIMEDPVLTLGYREYTGNEPMRAISWTQSARMGNLMVKNYDHL